MNDPIRPSDENPEDEIQGLLNELQPLQKWLHGEWSLFVIKFVLPGESDVQTSHVFGPSLEEVAKRCRQEWDGESLVSIARVDDFKEAGLVDRDIEYWLSSGRSHSQYLLAKAADLRSRVSDLRLRAAELRLRVVSAYSCLRDGVSI